MVYFIVGAFIIFVVCLCFYFNKQMKNRKIEKSPGEL